MRKQKLHHSQKRIILDYTGEMPLRLQPRKTSELDILFNALKETQPEKYKQAFDIVVNKIIPDAEDNSAVVASQVTAIVEKNVENLEHAAIASATNKIVEKINNIGGEVKKQAVEEIEKAKKEFHVIKVQVGNKKPKKIKGIVCEEFPRLLQLAQTRINIMMVGPSGSGKTHIAGQIAEALELDFASQSCSAGMSESQLTGWLLPISKGGNFQYVSSEFIRLYENGGVFLFDEMDAADPNVLIFINQALANGQFSLPQRFDNPLVKKHPDFVAIAAANTFGGGADAMYHARNALDAATLDRFRIGMVPIDYSHTVERRLSREDVFEWGLQVRLAIIVHGLRKIISTRVLRDASIMMDEQGWSLNDVAKAYFSDWTKEELVVIKRDYPYADSPDSEKKETSDGYS